MAGPWEKYKKAAPPAGAAVGAPAAASGPWARYGGAGAATPTAADIPITDADRAYGGAQPVAAPARADTLAERVQGVVEPLVAAGTGAIGTAVGALAGVGRSILGGNYGTQAGVREGEEFGGRVAQALTYQPRTQTGQAGTELLARAAAPLEGLAGVSAADALLAGRAVGASARSLRDLAEGVNAPINAADAAARAAPGGRLRDLVRAPQSTLAGAGAAATPEVTTRAQRFEQFGIKPTRGQLERGIDQVAFEREAAKTPEGRAINDRYSDQNAQFQRVFEGWADETGAQASGPRAVGKSVDAALRVKKEARQAEVRGIYAQARAAGELDAPVDVTALTNWVERNKGKDKLAPIVTAIENELKQNARSQGGGYDPLTLSQRPARTVMTLDASEDLRQAINKLAQPGTPNVVFGKEAKGLIDAAQEGKGGDLFRQARRAYENYANEFENRDVIDKLLRTKPGTKDRAVAFEDVADQALLNGSLDDAKHVFRVLEAHPAGTPPEIVAAGRQAAADLRGALIEHIKEKTFSNGGADAAGRVVGSEVKLKRIINELDRDGKLKAIFGEKGAQQLRDARDLAVDLYTSPAGTVNSSNNANRIVQALNKVANGVSFLGAGPAVRFVADQVESSRTRKKVDAALNPNLSDLSGGRR